MRRTRHVVLPVRSWQYIGLLIVSLACLTLGLVSRDREGHAGSLAGPELAHQAPHEVDVCPNLNAVAKMSSCPIADPEESTKSVDDRKIGVSEESRRSVFTRSLSLDRSSTIREQSRSRDLRAVDGRLERTRSRVADDDTSRRLRESRFRTTRRSRDIRNSFDVSRSRGLSNRATDRRSAEHGSQNSQHRLADRTNSRLEDRRSRSTERRELNEIARRQNRVERSIGSRSSLDLQRRSSIDRDRRSLSMERRIPSEIIRQGSRQTSPERREYQSLGRDRVDRRSEMREYRSVGRVVERASREDRRNLLDRSTRIARGDIDRNNNLDRRNRDRSSETRANRVANQVRGSSVAIRDSRMDRTGSDNRRSLSRSMERHLNDLSRERSSDRRLSSERRSLVRSLERQGINHLEQRKNENRWLNDRRSLDRDISRVLPADRQRISHTRKIVQRDSRENNARESSRIAPTRYDLEEVANRERRERLTRSSRSINSNSVDRRELARIEDSRDHERKSRESSATRRELNLERRERSNGLQRSHDERRIVPQKSRETERRFTADLARFASQRLSERRINQDKSREGSRLADRRLERSPELRISRERILEKPSLQRSSERRIEIEINSRSRERIGEQNRERISRERTSERRSVENSGAREGSRMQNRIRMNSELRNSMRMTEHRADSRAFLENKLPRSSDRRSDVRRDLQVRSQKEREVARTVETSNTELIRQQRQKSTNLNLVKKPSRLISAHRVVRISSNQIRDQPKLPVEGTLFRITNDDRSSAKWERNLRHTRIDKNTEIRTKTILESLKDYEFLKYPLNYDVVKQAFLVALCMVYGFSLHNSKKSYISSNIVQHVQRFMIW